MDFQLPEIGEGVQEGELISWLIKEGDSIEMDQPLVEVMTDKATVEIPSPITGTVQSISAKEGDIVKVGQTILVIAEGAGAGAGAEKGAPKGQKETKEAQLPEDSAGSGLFADETPSSTTPTSASTNTSSTYNDNPSSFLQNDNVPAAPIVRAMAQRQGVELSRVPGTGPKVGNQNRVLEEDLLNFINSSGSQTLQQQAPGTVTPMATPAKATQALPSRNVSGEENVERKPLRGLRRLIAQGMTKSKFTIPHYAYVDEFECSSLMEFRAQAKEVASKYGIKFSYLPFIVKALVAALKEYPLVNSSLEETENGSEVVMKKYYHIGIAAATDNGLVVPVIKHADQKSLLEIAKEINELSEKVRNNTAKADELKGSTFTITSMGNIGGLFATPIINYPEAGIMGVYKIQERPIVKNGQIVIGNMMTLSLSLDHRIVDGAIGGYFCNAVIDRLSNPAKMLLE